MNRITLIKDYLTKSTICHCPPRRIVIETTSRCNLKCKMCLRTIKMNRPAKDMNLKTFQKIISNNRKNKLEFISLQAYGEPLLHSQIFEMIRLAKSFGIRTGISSNATVLDKVKSHKLLKAGLDYIIFAFDGATKKTYEDIRRGANYEQVEKNIQHFLEIKRDLNSDIFVVIQCIYMAETANEIAAFKRKWKMPGVNALRIRQLTQGISNYDESVRRQFFNRRDIPCYWLWTEPTILWDGTVIPCCQDVNGDYALGNINKTTLFQIWNSSKMQRLRKNHLEGKRSTISICRDCNMYQPSLPLALISGLFNVFTLNKIVPYAESIISYLRYR